jgi:AhpC/TSA family
VPQRAAALSQGGEPATERPAYRGVNPFGQRRSVSGKRICQHGHFAQASYNRLVTHPEGNAPDFALLDAHGTMVRLSDFRGRPVILTFLRGFR